MIQPKSQPSDDLSLTYYIIHPNSQPLDGQMTKTWKTMRLKLPKHILANLAETQSLWLAFLSLEKATTVGMLPPDKPAFSHVRCQPSKLEGFKARVSSSGFLQNPTIKVCSFHFFYPFFCIDFRTFIAKARFGRTLGLARGRISLCSPPAGK